MGEEGEKKGGRGEGDIGGCLACESWKKRVRVRVRVRVRDGGKGRRKGGGERVFARLFPLFEIFLPLLIVLILLFRLPTSGHA